MDSDFEDIVTNKVWVSQKCCLPPREIPHLKFMHSNSGPERFFKIKEQLGYGGFGKVFAVQDYANGKDYALKVVDKVKRGKTAGAKPRKVNLSVLVREISLLRVLKHQNIVELFEIYESPKEVCLVLEQCQDSLYNFLIKRNSPLNEAETSYVVHGVATALDYLHSYEIAHRDIKLQNILFARTCTEQNSSSLPFGEIKLSDFGLGACRGPPGTFNLFTCCCGTPEYMAPEVLAKTPYGTKCDIWSLGVVTFYCLIGMPPFPGKTQSDVQFQIKLSKVTLKGKSWKPFSENVKRLIKKMLTVNPSERCSAKDILEKSWTHQLSKEYY